jgi:ribonuclease-3 family protein
MDEINDIKAFNSYIMNAFDIDKKDIRTYSPLTLAYIGDGIFDLVIRSVVVGAGNTSANQLHRHTSHIVKAHSQAVMVEALMEDMTEEEQDIYRRGRNAKSHTTAKNATVADYRSATGFEAVMGFLYMTDQLERIVYLCKLGIDKTGLTL